MNNWSDEVAGHPQDMNVADIFEKHEEEEKLNEGNESCPDNNYQSGDLFLGELEQP